MLLAFLPVAKQIITMFAKEGMHQGRDSSTIRCMAALDVTAVRLHMGLPVCLCNILVCTPCRIHFVSILKPHGGCCSKHLTDGMVQDWDTAMYHCSILCAIT